MKASEYRKQVEHAVKKRTEKKASYSDFLDKSKKSGQRLKALEKISGIGRTGDEITQSLSIIEDGDEGIDIRIGALNAILSYGDLNKDLFERILGWLKDEAFPVKMKLSALEIVQGLKFSSPVIWNLKSELNNTLRSLIEDKNKTLRHKAIEMLAVDKDEVVQRRLMDQLRGNSKAVIGTTKAIKLLGYDVHGDHYELLREIVKESPSKSAKKEALRILATDPSSKDLLTEILQDKNENREIRQICAAALNSLAPDEFEDKAIEIVLDENDYDDIRATSINVLQQYAKPSKLQSQPKLNEQIKSLSEKASSKALKRAAKQYINKSMKF